MLRRLIVAQLLRANFQSLISIQKTVAISFAAVFLFVGTGCQTSRVEESGRRKATTGTEFGQWRGHGTATRIIKRDGSERAENWTVNLEIVSRTPGFGRIEVTGVMGVYGGTIAWNKDETRILLPGQKKFVIAPNSPQAFLSILPVEVSPGEIESILFDREFDEASLKERGITCKSKENRQVCGSRDGFMMERSRGFEATGFEIKSADGSRLKMQLKPTRSKVEEKAELWALEPPRGFKVVR